MTAPAPAPAPAPTPLLRLSGIKTSQLPSPSASPDELRPFITSLLQEAVPFIDSAAPRAADKAQPASSSNNNKLWKSKGTRKFAESDAQVELSERVVPLGPSAGPAAKPAAGTETGTETWACRRSVHADAATRGTASWGEFVACIRDDHAATEDAFTPAVLAHHVVVGGWPGAAGLPAVEAGGVSWGGFGMSLVEMKHRIPPPLKPRVFPVVQVVCSAEAGAKGEGEADEFLVVSVTVGDLPVGDMRSMARLSVEKGVVVGAYASVERVRRLPAEGAGDVTGKRERVEWVMATASDARGVLPMWVQTKAIPGQIAKDVSLFLGWINTERSKKKKKGGGGGVEGGKNGTEEAQEEAAVAVGAQQGENAQVGAAS